jgi:Tfp pilus assembly protein FimT
MLSKKSSYPLIFTILGLSLFEMLITIMLMGILAGMSLPFWSNFTSNVEAKILLSQLSDTIAFSKEAAQLYQQPIALCKSNNQKTCSGSWINGQIIFLDENKNGENQGRPLRVITPLTSQGKLYFRSYPIYRNYLLFFPEFVNDNGTFWYCGAHDKMPVWAVMLSQMGNIHVRYRDKDGLLKDARGRLLLCG